MFACILDDDDADQKEIMLGCILMMTMPTKKEIMVACIVAISPSARFTPHNGWGSPALRALGDDDDVGDVVNVDIYDVVNEHKLMSNMKHLVPFFLFYLCTFCLGKRKSWAGSEAK